MITQVVTSVEPDHQIVLALISVIAVSVGALVYTIRNNTLVKGLDQKAEGIAKDAADVSSAVNHKETGELSLYRLASANSTKLDAVMAKQIEFDTNAVIAADKLDAVVAKQAEFDRKWGNLPAGLGDAVGLVGLLHDIERQLTDVQTELRGHIAWELAVKYPKGEP